MQRRGHQVLLATAEPFRQTVESRGLAFHSILSASEYAGCLSNPDLWHRRRFFQTFVGGFMLPSIAAIVRLVQGLPRPQEVTLVSAFSGSPGARLAQEITGARHLSMWVDPAALRSSHQPPVVSGLEFLSWLPYALRKLAFWMVDRHADWRVCAPLNRLRGQCGLAPVRSVLQWMVSEHRSICLFPEWYAQPQPDWPTDSRAVGFPLVAPGPLPADVQAFLDLGEAPVVVTFGTGMNFAGQEFSTALEACLQNGQRALLVAPPQALVPPLPVGCAVFRNRPSFEALLPRARAIIHHGGIGTVAQALGCGLPQLAVPLAHDHPDNAARIQRLGVGVGLPRKRFCPPRASAALAHLLAADVWQRCRQLADRIGRQNGLESACLALEQP